MLAAVTGWSRHGRRAANRRPADCGRPQMPERARRLDPRRGHAPPPRLLTPEGLPAERLTAMIGAYYAGRNWRRRRTSPRRPSARPSPYPAPNGARPPKTGPPATRRRSEFGRLAWLWCGRPARPRIRIGGRDATHHKRISPNRAGRLRAIKRRQVAALQRPLHRDSPDPIPPPSPSPRRPSIPGGQRQGKPATACRSSASTLSSDSGTASRASG